MSFERRGAGNRRRHRDEYEDRRREAHESPDERLRNDVIKFGEVDAIEELPRLEAQIREHSPRNIANLSDAFRISVTEQPYKIPYYAALLRSLHEPGENDGEESMGRLILKDFWKGFQAYLDRVAWRETRLCIHFFAHLTMASLISTESMFSLLQSFLSVLDEPGMTHGRAKRAALCAGEGLMIAGPALKAMSWTSVNEIISGIEAYNETTSSRKWLAAPTAQIAADALMTEGDELLDILISSLRALNANDFMDTSSCYPRPYTMFPELDPALARPFDLPSCLVPPEVIELDALSSETGEETQIKKEEWPEYFMRLFTSDISPDAHNPTGYIVRTALLDIIDIFEVNRKECARLLLEYPKWNLPGTFKPRPGAAVDVDPIPGKDWQLESTVVETILGALFLLPESHKSIYYISLITELCKLSPATVGPAVGKSIRKLYSLLAEGLDVEVARRFAEWFAVHMSNFGFQWVWKEWIPDLNATVQHPRRAFMRRAVEFEIRLSYHDRILRTLPDVMQSPEAYTISSQAPGPDFEYDDPSNPHHEAANSILNLFRGRTKVEDVISHLDTLKGSLETSEPNVDSVVRSIAIQSLLHIGSRSFSHLLNAIERYLPLLRYLASDGVSTSSPSNNTGAKADILTAAAAFWKHNRQMVGIVFDKLMQYQIVDPTDVVAWTFVNGSDVGQLREVTSPMNLSAFEWDLLKGALDKANGRVIIARRKVATLRKEEDDTRARVMASANDGMEVDLESKPEKAEDSPALLTALKAFNSLTREQKAALSRTLEGFVSCLAPSLDNADPNSHSRAVIRSGAWNDRENWGGDEWNSWETWGWYKQFCRAYSPYLREYSTTLYTVSLSRLEGTDDPAAALLKKIWDVAVLQEA